MPDSTRLKLFQSAFDFSESQVRRMVEKYPDYYPMYTKDGRWGRDRERIPRWTEGFLPGMMWIFYRKTGDPWWRNEAERYTTRLEPRKFDPDIHDHGYLFLASYGRWAVMQPSEAVETVLREAAETLAKRFRPKGEYLCSYMGADSLFIDIMMNVGLLFRVAKQTGDARIRDIALRHVRTSLSHLVRSDGSTAQEALFNLETGEFLRHATHQGLRPDTCWSRGQVWGLYGFGSAARHTGEVAFLDAAERCADYFLAHLPPERVPWWDFHVPEGERRIHDSSAAAAAASGLLNLAKLARSGARQKAYREGALQILAALSAPPFLARGVEGQEGILLHGVYHYHKGWAVDESLAWGDYFFVEALAKVLGVEEELL
ncbi:MAG: glycoside hydrolase family 88 protein [Planctomycetota bacterium]